jgi:hypothetical protein
MITDLVVELGVTREAEQRLRSTAIVSAAQRYLSGDKAGDAREGHETGRPLPAVPSSVETKGVAPLRPLAVPHPPP